MTAIATQVNIERVTNGFIVTFFDAMTKEKFVRVFASLTTALAEVATLISEGTSDDLY